VTSAIGAAIEGPTYSYEKTALNMAAMVFICASLPIEGSFSNIKQVQRVTWFRTAEIVAIHYSMNEEKVIIKMKIGA